ncbi:MAG: DUF2892 domain-containing protein [Candidatus Altiarchaeota archaeon]|nr:DUF2892 domain-containing protein [Candidatus Altiarchaeota archaeon]
MKFEKNEGKLDRILRLVFGALLVGWGIYTANWWGLLGLILIVTGITGYCSLYPILGINTVSVKKK